MKFLFIVIFFLAVFNQAVVSQSIQIIEPDSRVIGNKNLVYGTLALGGYYLLNYEREIFKTGIKQEGRINLAAGFGGFVLFDFVHDIKDPNAPALILSSNFISRGDKNHLETNFGIAYTSKLDLEDKEPSPGLVPCIKPCINLGYRFQEKRNTSGQHNPKVFRCGLGYPLIFYFSFGYGF